MRHPLAAADFLTTLGIPVQRRLRASGLPAFCEDPDAFVPLSAVWRFFHLACKLDVPSVGWRAGRHLEDAHLNHQLLARLETAPTLFRALDRFIRLARSEASHIRLGLAERGDDLVLYTHYPDRKAEPGYGEAQLYQLQVIKSLIRHFIGPRWMPAAIGIQGNEVPRVAQEDLPDSRFLRRQRVGYLVISRQHLYRSVSDRLSPNANSDDPTSVAAHEYVEILRSMLRAYLPEGYPTARFAADLMNTSSRTLSRNLAASGLRYRELVDELRFEVAKELVCQPEVKLSEIAWRVGFTDQSHFTRMFRRVGGVTPGRMRRDILEGPAPHTSRRRV